MLSPHVPPTEEDFVFRRRAKSFPFREPATVSRMLLLALAFGALLGGLRVEAGLVYWGSEGFVVNADSRSRAWTPDFVMEMGVFSKGFVPVVGNRESWRENWFKLGTADFDPQEARFAGVADLSKPLPAGADSKVYFWARNGEDLAKGPEWLLLTRPEWVWPASSPVGSPAMTWTTTIAATSVVGGIGEGGFHLISERVVPVPVLLAQWLAEQFPDSPANRSPDLDPDGDGLDNRLEYFLGSDPADPSSMVTPGIHPDGENTFLSLRRNPQASSRFVVETSANLLVWSRAEQETIQDRPDLIEVRVPRTPSVNAAFFRIKLEEAAP